MAERLDRRAFLAAAGAAAASGTVGCLDAVGSAVSDPQAKWVVHWNENLLGAVSGLPYGTPILARQAACLNVSIFDAVNAIAAASEESHFEPYGGGYGDVPANASPVAAVGGAAHEIISHEYPVFRETLDEKLRETRDHADDLGGDVDAGEEWGRSVAIRVIESRSDDGHDESEEYRSCDDRDQTPGCWQGEAVGGTWGTSHHAFVDTWTLTEPVSFEGPPPLESEAYADAWHEVHEYDYGDGMDQEDEAIARYWFGGEGSALPPGRWIRIAGIAAEELETTLLESARVMALVSLGLADTAISVWNAKHEYGFWRPYPAIHGADADGNSETSSDPEWEPIKIGGGPEYPSGLACYGSTARSILVETFDTDELSFEMTSVGPPRQTRSFEGFTDAFEESWKSRLRLGVHFRFSLEDSIPAGERIADEVLGNQVRPVD